MLEFRGNYKFIVKIRFVEYKMFKIDREFLVLLSDKC